MIFSTSEETVFKLFGIIFFVSYSYIFLPKFVCVIKMENNLKARTHKHTCVCAQHTQTLSLIGEMWLEIWTVVEWRIFLFPFTAHWVIIS